MQGENEGEVGWSNTLPSLSNFSLWPIGTDQATWATWSQSTLSAYPDSLFDWFQLKEKKSTSDIIFDNTLVWKWIKFVTDQIDNAKSINLAVQKEIDEQEKNNTLTKAKIAEIKNKYAPVWFMDSVKSFIWNVWAGTVTDWDNSEDKFNKAKTSEINELYSNSGYNKNDFTNRVWNVFDIGTDQNQSTINGAMNAEDDYVRVLNESTGISYDEITAYQQNISLLNNPEIKKISAIMAWDYSSIPEYQGLVSTMWREKANLIINENYKDAFAKIEELTNNQNSFKTKIGSINKSFEVNLPGIWSTFFSDSTKTNVTPIEILNKLDGLRNINDIAIKKATWLTRDEYNQVSQKESEDRRILSFDDTIIDGIKKTTEYKNIMQNYDYMSPNDRSVKSNEIVENINANLLIDERINKTTDGQQKTMMLKQKDDFNAATELLNSFNDNIANTIQRNRAAGMYSNLTDVQARNKVADELISNFSEDQKNRYKQSLQTVDTTNALITARQWITEIKDSALDFNVAKTVSWLWHAATGGGGLVFDAIGDSLEYAVHSDLFLSGPDAKFRGDLLSYSSGVRNINWGLSDTLKDISLYNQDKILSVAVSLLNPNPEAKVAIGASAITKLMKSEKVLDSIAEGLETWSRTAKIISKIKSGVNLTEDESLLIQKNKALSDAVNSRKAIINSDSYKAEIAATKAFESGTSKDSLTDKIRFAIETSKVLNKSTKLAGATIDSTLVWFKADTAIDQAFWGMVDDGTLAENLVFNLLGDAVIGSTILWIWKKYMKHGIEVSDVAKLFDTTPELLDAVNDIRRRALKLNGGQLISKTDALKIVKWSMEALAWYSAKNARIETKEDILDFTRKAMEVNPKYENNITDSGMIISFNDNLSRLSSQETRLSEFERLYNDAVTYKNTDNIAFYGKKIEQELKLVESLTIDPSDLKNHLKEFVQNKASYLGTDLKIDSKVIRSEIDKWISTKVEKLRKVLNDPKKEKISTSDIMDFMTNTITTYDESKQFRKMRAYDAYTQKEIIVDQKEFNMQSQALSLEKNISLEQAQSEIIDKGGITVQNNMVYADVVGKDGRYFRAFWFSKEWLIKTLWENQIPLWDAIIHDTKSRIVTSRFNFWNKRANEINKGLSEQFKISEFASNWYNVSFTKWVFGKDNIDKHIARYIDSASELSFNKVVDQLNIELEQLLPEFQIPIKEFVRNVENGLWKVFQNNAILYTMDSKKLLRANAAFAKIPEDQKMAMVHKVNEMITKAELKYYSDIMEQELWEGIVSKNSMSLGNIAVSYKSIIEQSQKQDALLTIVHGSIINAETPTWKELIYILPGSKLKGKIEYRNSVEKAFNNIKNEKEKKISGLKIMQPMRDYSHNVISELLRIKGVRGGAIWLDNYLDIIEQDYLFDVDAYIKSFYKEWDPEIEDVQNMVSYLQKNILVDDEQYINESITKNFIHNYVLNKEEIDKFVRNFDSTDSQILVLRNILLSETSKTWIINKETDKALSWIGTDKVEAAILFQYNREKDIFWNRIQRQQDVIDKLREQLKNGSDWERDLLGSEIIDLNKKIQDLILNQKKEKLISFEDYRQRNIGIIFYQQAFNKVTKKIIDDTNNFANTFIKERWVVAYEIKKNLNQISIEDRKRIEFELRNYSNINLNESESGKLLDITKEIELLDLRKARANVIIKDYKKSLSQLEGKLTSNIAKDEKKLAMKEYLQSREEELENLSALSKQLENIQTLKRPKKVEILESDIIEAPEKVTLDIKASELIALKKDISYTTETIQKHIEDIKALEAQLDSESVKNILEKFSKIQKSIDAKKVVSDAFWKVYDDIKLAIRAWADINTLKVVEAPSWVLGYEIAGNKNFVIMKNLSDAQTGIIRDVLMKLEKNRAWVTELKLDVQDLRNAKTSIHTQSEIKKVIQKDITDSLFLNYTQKVEHEKIIENFRKNFGTSTTENLDGQFYMSQLYQKKNTKFSKLIDSLYIKNPDDTESINKIFDNFLLKLVDGLEYSYRWNDGILHNITGEQILKNIDRERIRNRFSSLRYQDSSVVKKMDVVLSPDWFINYASWVSQFIETPLVFKAMKESLWENIRFIDWFSEKTLKAFIKDQPVFRFAKWSKLNNMDLLWLINGTKFDAMYWSGKDSILWIDLVMKYRAALWLEKWEILTLWFGDKDWFAIVYKNHKVKFKDTTSIEDKAEITALTYFYDMAISSWFIKIDKVTAEKTFNSFIKDFNKMKDGSFENFQKTLFTYEKNWIRLTDITAGAKRYKNESDELIQWFRMFKTSSDDIRKRMGSSASKRNLFQWYVGKKAKYEWDLKKYLQSSWHKALILRKVKDTDLEDIFSWIESTEEKVVAFRKYAEDKKINVNSIFNEIDIETKQLPTNEKILERIEKQFLDDLEDGTWYITEDIWKINGKINGGSETVLKSHIQWVNTDWLINLGKGQMNAARVAYDGVELTETLMMWEGMHKIKWGWKDLRDASWRSWEFIEMKQGNKYVKYEIIGIDDNIDYSFYKEATSTRVFPKDNVSINNLIGWFEGEYLELLNSKIRNKITKRISEFQKNYISDDKLQDFYGNVNVLMKKLIEWNEELKYSDQYYNQKFEWLFSDLKWMIDEIRTEWYWFKALNASVDIHPDEVLIHPSNPLAKKLLKDFWDGEKYIVTTRYPVSDKYVSGIYRVVFDSSIDKKHIITHPENAFYKLRADFDGDTITWYSLKDEYGSIAWRAIFGNAQGFKPQDIISWEKSLIDMNIDDLVTYIDSNFDFSPTGARLNTYIEAPEVSTVDSHTYRNFITNTFIAQKAKNGISIGASTVRTADIMQRAIDKLVAAGPSQVNEVFSSMNPYIQRVIANGILWKWFRDIDIFSANSSSKAADFVNFLNKQWFAWGKYLEDWKVKYNISHIYGNTEWMNAKEKEKFHKNLLKTIGNNIYKFSDSRKWYTSINTNHRFFQSKEITIEDMKKLSSIKQDKEFAIITGTILNDFLDFWKSWKESIPLDFDKKMIEKMYGDVDLPLISKLLSQLGTVNKPKWGEKIQINDFDFLAKLNDGVSGDSVDLWNFAYDNMSQILELKNASNEIPFILWEYKKFITDEQFSKVREALSQLELEKSNGGKERIKKYANISNLLYDENRNYIDSTVFFTKEQKKNILSLLIPDLNKDLAKYMEEIRLWMFDWEMYNLSEIVPKFMDKVEAIRVGDNEKDIVTTVLLSRTLPVEFQKTLKKYSVNNISIQNTMSESMIVNYFKSVSDTRQNIMKKQFSNLSEDTKSAYLESIDEMKTVIDSKINESNDLLRKIREGFSGKYITINETYATKKILLNVEQEALAKKSEELAIMNQNKKSYFLKKEKYEKDLKDYEEKIQKLWSDQERVIKELEKYESDIKEYALWRLAQIEIQKDIWKALWLDVSKMSNDEIISELDKKIENVFDDAVKYNDRVLFDLKLSQDNITLDGDAYIVKVWDQEYRYDRVSNYTSKPNIVSVKNKKLFEYSAEVWRWAEAVIRDIFDNKKAVFWTYEGLENFINEDAFNAFVQNVKTLKKEFEERGEIIYSKDIKIKDDTLELAWEVNLITETSDWKYKLYDIRTIRDNGFYEWKISELNNEKWNQLSMYAHILENNYKIAWKNIVIDEINVLVFKADYDFKKAIAWFNAPRISNDLRSLKYSDTVTLSKRKNIYEINLDLIDNNIRTYEDVISPQLTYKENFKVMKKYISEIDQQKTKLNAKILNSKDEYFSEFDKIDDSDILFAMQELEDLGNILKIDVDNVTYEKYIWYKNPEIENLLIEKEKLESIQSQIRSVRPLKQNTDAIKELVQEKLNVFSYISDKDAVKLTINDMYAWWNNQMSERVSKDLKWVLDTFEKDWNFQFVDELKNKDPELLDRINAISYHMGADFLKLNDQVIQWDNILKSINKWLDGEKVWEVVDLTESEIEEFDKVSEKLLYRLKSAITWKQSDEVHKIWRAIKEAINGSFIWEGGKIVIDEKLTSDLLRKRIIAQDTNKISYEKSISKEPSLVRLVDAYFPDMPISEFTQWHLNYLFVASNKQLQYNIQKYINGTVAYALEKANTLDAAVWEDLNLLELYGKNSVKNKSLTRFGEESHSSLLVDDIMESAKWDNNLAIISMGLSKKEDFMKRFIDNWFSEKNANIMYNQLFKKENTTGQKYLDFLNFINYELKYGKLNLLHGAGTIAATIQMLWQMTEILTKKASFGGIADSEIINIRKYYKILDGEDTHVFGSGIAIQSQDNPFVWLGTDTISNMAYQINEKVWSSVKWLIDLATSPLGKQDAPFDVIRKEAAIKQTMFENGYKTYEDLVLGINKFWSWELRRFETRARMIYNELGGWVSSKDSLYKINKAFNLSGYADIPNRSEFVSFALKSWETMGWYMIHWMANKTVRQGEVLVNLGRATLAWDWKAARELSALAISRIRNMTYIALMGLKYDKYQDIDTSRKDGVYKLVQALANDIVALNALTSFAINTHEKARLADAWFGEESIMMLQALTARFTGSLNSVPNFTNSLYSKIKIGNWNKLSYAERLGLIFWAVTDSIKDNGGNFNRYSGITQSEYGSRNIGISFSSMTGQWVGWFEWELERLGWLGYLTDQDIQKIREGGFENYFKYWVKAFIWDKWIKSWFGLNSTEVNNASQPLKIFLESSSLLMETDKIFHDPEAGISSIFDLLLSERYTSWDEDYVDRILNGKNVKVHKNQLILLDQIADYYRSNWWLALYNLNDNGTSKKSYSQEEGIRRNLMQKEFGDLGEQFTKYTQDGGTLNYATWVEDRLAGYMMQGDGDIIIDRHVIAIPEITDFILDASFTDKKKAYLENLYWKKYYSKWKWFDDIRDFDEKKMYMDSLLEFKGILSMDRWLKRVIDDTALYLDNDLQKKVYESTWYYLPLDYRDDGEEKAKSTWGSKEILPVDLNKYKQSDSKKEQGLKIMQRLQGFVKEDDLADELIAQGRIWNVSSSFKVLANGWRDVWIVTRTMEKAREQLSDEEFKDLSLMFLDNINTNLSEKTQWWKLQKMFEESWAMKEYVNYMYNMTDAIKDYDTSESDSKWDYIGKSFSAYGRYGAQQQYKWWYGQFSPGGSTWLSQGYEPIRQFVNQNKWMLYPNPAKVIQSYIAAIPFRPTYANQRIINYIGPRLQQMNLGQSQDVIKETGGPIWVKDNVTYKKISKIKKIRVRQNKVQSKLVYRKTSWNLLRWLAYGADDF